MQDIGTVTGINAYKSPLIPSIETNAVTVDAATLGLPAAAGTTLAQGRYLNAATDRQPVAVLGATTAQLMGIDRIRPGMRIWLGPGDTPAPTPKPSSSPPTPGSAASPPPSSSVR